MTRVCVLPLLICLCVAFAVVSPSAAQDGRPTPDRPEQRGNETGGDEATDPDATGDEQDPPDGEIPERIGPDDPHVELKEAAERDPSTNRRRRPDDDELVKLGFNNVEVNQFIPFITETTGKVVIPYGATLGTKNITVINDEWITRREALDYIFQAFRLNDIGIVETPTIIQLTSSDDAHRSGFHQVLGPGMSLIDRRDVGNLVTKVFELEHTAAETVSEQLGELPDGTNVAVDAASNQLIVTAPVSVGQRIGALIEEIDKKPFDPARRRVFKLQYADAAAVAENIEIIFASDTSGTGRNAQQRRAAARRGQAQQQGESSALEPVEMRVSVNAQQNAVIVHADMSIMEDIDDLITNHLDQEISPQVVRTYDLKYTDPLKVEEILQEMLGGGSFGGGRRRPGGGGRDGGQAGGSTEVSDVVGRIYNIRAYPDSQRLVVISKTEDNFRLLDHMIQQIDTPIDPGLPTVIDLKHADAVDVTEQLNALLAPAGADVRLPRPPSGLTQLESGSGPASGGGQSTLGQSPLSGLGRGGQGGQGGDAGDIQFPWQQGRDGDQAQSDESSLIGKVRIVPIIRQNSIAVLGPPEYRNAIEEMIADNFDRPGRQVMISAVIAEIQLSDALDLGLRLSSGEGILGAERSDFAFGAQGEFSAQEENVLGSLFDSSVLDVSFNLNAFFQALASRNAVRILQEPRIFTADNQEAIFFDGQAVPFITDTFVTDVGSQQQGFDYQDVGITLQVRPRITSELHVDMDINLELSSVQPGETAFGGFILDRRNTSTKIIVENGQTIVLSGILKEEETEQRRGIPLLSDIPIIGEFFAHRSESTSRSELVAFITPRVVENPSDNRTNYNVEERRRLQRMSEPLDEQRRDVEDPDLIRRQVLERTQDGTN